MEEKRIFWVGGVGEVMFADLAARQRRLEDILTRFGADGTLFTPTPCCCLPEKGLNRLDWQIKPYKTNLTES